MTSGCFSIGTVGPGHLSIGPRPKLQDFTVWLKMIETGGIDHVVSLITREEVEAYGLNGEGRSLNDIGRGFTHFPIDDFDTPDVDGFSALIANLKKRLENGEHLFLHCAGGIGRAGTTASCLLIEFGSKANDAMAKVSAARGETCPETPDQVAFVQNWAV